MFTILFHSEQYIHVKKYTERISFHHIFAQVGKDFTDNFIDWLFKAFQVCKTRVTFYYYA